MAISPLSTPNKILMQTSKGEVEFELYPERAPETVKNFVQYIQKGFYSGTTFHRVIKGFMIQGGGYTSDLERKDTMDPIKSEADNGMCNTTGTISMARRSEINSATAQFFINLNNNTSLDHKNSTAEGFGYCVFGKVTKGMDVVRSIGDVVVATNDTFNNVPIEPVLITKMTIIKKEESHDN